MRERFAEFFFDAPFIAGHELFQIVGIQIGIERVAVAILMVVQNLLEVMMIDAEDDVGIHGDKAAVAVQREAAVAGFGGKRLHRHVVEPEIEHRVHHAGHRGARAGAD